GPRQGQGARGGEPRDCTQPEPAGRVQPSWTAGVSRGQPESLRGFLSQSPRSGSEQFRRAVVAGNTAPSGGPPARGRKVFDPRAAIAACRDTGSFSVRAIVFRRGE